MRDTLSTIPCYETCFAIVNIIRDTTTCPSQKKNEYRWPGLAKRRCAQHNDVWQALCRRMLPIASLEHMRYYTLVLNIYFSGARRESVWQVAIRKKSPNVSCRAPHQFPRVSAGQQGASVRKLRRVHVPHRDLDK